MERLQKKRFPSYAHGRGEGRDIYAYEAEPVTAAADSTRVNTGPTHLPSAPPQKTREQLEQERRRKEELERRHADARKNTWASMMAGAIAAGRAAGPKGVLVGGGVGLIAGMVQNCTNQGCHLNH